MSIVYLDNNGTTPMCKASKKEAIKWFKNPANPSGENVYAIKARELLQSSVKAIKKHSNANHCEVIFTSGATESNCTILRSIIDGWWNTVQSIPHIIISSIEHTSILHCLDLLMEEEKVEVTMIDPNQYGIIDPVDVESNIQDNTCLISIMMANNEIGSINPIKRIVQIAHSKNPSIPVHSDATQMFGKYKLDLKSMGVDVISMCFHKLYGPTGCGLLIVDKALIEGYELHGIINGKQQGGLRAGTEPIPIIAASMAALLDTFINRSKKNKHLLKMRNETIKYLKKNFTQINAHEEHKDEKKHDKVEFSILGPPVEHTKLYIPNTLLLCFNSHKKKICNVKLRNWLNSKKVIVSIGSTCNTASNNASHVIDAINLPKKLYSGVIRISFGDQNTMKDVDKLCRTLKSAFVGNKNIYM